MAKPKRYSKRQRRQAREKAHDLRSRYHDADLPLHNNIAISQVEDAFAPAAYIDTEGNLDARARLKQARHADGTIAEGAQAGRRPAATGERRYRAPRRSLGPHEEPATD